MIARMMFVRAVVGTAIAWMLLAEVCGCRAPLASERTEALSATEPQEQAKDGDATAQYNLGICYYNGDGVVVDKAEAVKWLRKAAEKGHLQAQTLIGAFYFQGDGVAVDKAEAIKWFRKAAVQGYPQAQSILGSCYFKGEGVAEDQAEAVKWFRKAAEKGHPESQGMLGLCYFKGEGVAVNYAEAVKWFRKAAEKGRPESQTMLGMCYLNGEGVAADKTEAVKWLWKAAEQGYLLAQEELEKISGTVPAEQFTPRSRISDPPPPDGEACARPARPTRSLRAPHRHDFDARAFTRALCAGGQNHAGPANVLSCASRLSGLCASLRPSFGAATTLWLYSWGQTPQNRCKKPVCVLLSACACQI